jgi:predicted permease
MSDLLFSLDATLPVFLNMMLGFIFHACGWIDDLFAERLNRFVFRIALPVMLFLQLGTSDFKAGWDGRYVLFCFLSTLLGIGAAVLISLMIPEVPKRGEFIQSAYRSSAAILGIAYISNIYGDSVMGPLMIIGAVPLYNVMAVTILALTAENNRGLSRSMAVSTLKGVVTNPIILGIVSGCLFGLTGLSIEPVILKTLESLAHVATPLGLLALGASIKPDEAGGEMKTAAVASFIKLVGLCAVFLPVAAAMGFRREKLVGILIMLGSPTTCTSFIMAKNMGHDGTISSNTVIITTLASAFTLTFWIYLLRTLSLI